MKPYLKQFFFFTCLMLIAIGCTTPEKDIVIENPIEYNPETDYQYYLHQDSSGQGITESEDGYYFINGSYLYYMDKISMEPILLDNNPNNDCPPSNTESIPRNCNAYLYNEKIHFEGTVIYYKGHLYVLHIEERTDKDVFGSKQYVLVQMNKDGSNRKVIREFDTVPSPVIIHRDMIYFVDRTQYQTNTVHQSILSIPLANPKQEPTTLYTVESADLTLNDIIAYGHYLYVTEMGPNMYRTVQYNLNTHEHELLYRDYENASITSIQKDTLFFGLFSGDPTDEQSWENYSSNLNGQEIFKLPIKIPIVSRLLVDDRYYYLNPVSWYSKGEQFAQVEEAMIIYDANYKEIERVDMSMMGMWAFAYPGNEQHMFFRTYDATYDYQSLYYLDKSTIGRGDAKLEFLAESAAPLR